VIDMWARDDVERQDRDGFVARRLVRELRRVIGDAAGGFEFAEVVEPVRLSIDLLGDWLRETGRVEARATVARLAPTEPFDASPCRSVGDVGVFRIERPEHGVIWINAEVVMAVGHEVVAVAAFKGREDLDWLLGELRALRLRRSRARGFVVVGDGDLSGLPTITWDDVILPGRLKLEIRESVDDFVGGQERCRRFRIAWRRGLLLVGPAGDGKTTVCKAIAATSGLPFVYARPRGDWSNREIDHAFRTAKELAPSILCIEDIDSLFKTNVTLSHLLNRLDGFDDNTGLLILATSNHPEQLARALLQRPSRFDRVWRFPRSGPSDAPRLPSPPARRHGRARDHHEGGRRDGRVLDGFPP
jgi:adenylate kinase family enzyme